MRLTEQPGCALAVASKGKVVLEAAFGHANLVRGAALTPRHRFRVASQSKTFTAAGVLKLCDRRRLRLDDPIGTHVDALPRRIASITVAQLLAHGGGLARDGDTRHWYDRAPFPDEARLREALGAARVIEPDTRFKYSNLGYGLLGLAIEARSGERYADWIAREVIAAAALEETVPDMPLPRGTPLAQGHGAKLPLGRRVVVPGANEARALAAATGFVSTASDLARFFASLAPNARNGWLSAASRRAMARRLWRDTQQAAERWYGLGTMSGALAGWDWFGHSGAFQGTITRTVCVPSQGLSISVLTNAVDGAAHAWVDGIVQILSAHARHGAPSRTTAAWSGRWWTPWGAVDLVPTRARVFVANPALADPFLDAVQLAPSSNGRANGALVARVVESSGFGNPAEDARLVRDARGRPRALWLAGTELQPERAAARELAARYEPDSATSTAARGRSTPTARRKSSSSYGLRRNAS